MPVRTDRETHYVAAYLEFWSRPYDWSDQEIDSPVSSFAPVRTWLASLQTGLHVASLRRAMRAVAAKVGKPPPLDPIRSAYFRELQADRDERMAERMATGTCAYCGNTGAVYVATWTDRHGRNHVMSPRSPHGIRSALRESAVACTCCAGDDAAKRGDWSAETRRRFVALRLTPSQFVCLRSQVMSMAVEEEERREPAF